MDLQELGLGGMDWTDLAQDRGRWRDIGNAVINLRVKTREIYQIHEELVSPQEELFAPSN
jgi:hypothetical protein